MMKSKRLFLLAALLVCCATYATEASAVPMPLTKCGNIIVSGSYMLTKNVTAAGDCFVIQVDDVTIDLDGYRITGDGTGRGIGDNALPRKNITVRNGVVSNFEIGIFFPNSSRVTVERMRVTQNTAIGIVVLDGAIIKDNVASDNGVVGISAIFGNLITGNVANDNGQ